MSKTFIQKVATVQSKLKAPKSQFNKFGNYSYRNQEDILEAVKPLLKEEGLVLTINDEILEFSGKMYIKSTATVTDGENKLSNSAFAREADEAKGMSPSQITGSCSSYSRKYSLNGLFLIDDTKDADATNTHGKTESRADVTATEQAGNIKKAATIQTGLSASSTESKPPASFKRPTKPTTTTTASDDL